MTCVTGTEWKPKEGEHIRQVNISVPGMRRRVKVHKAENHIFVVFATKFTSRVSLL